MTRNRRRRSKDSYSASPVATGIVALLLAGAMSVFAQALPTTQPALLQPVGPLPPTLLANAPRQARVVSEEVFGPVVAIEEVASLDEAVCAPARIPPGRVRTTRTATCRRVW